MLIDQELERRKNLQEQLRDGYRIPKIEEFINGFKYEVYSEGYFEDSIEDFCGWYEYEFNQGMCWRDIEDIERELKNGNIQVRRA